jgi:membrane-associated phospholipid phosphatase
MKRPAAFNLLDFAARHSMIARIMANKPWSSKKTAVVAVSLTVLFVIALALDIPVSTRVHESGLDAWLKNEWDLTHIIRIPGHFIFTLVACVALLGIAWTAGVRGTALWRKPSIVLLAAIFSGINAPLKWMIGRIRPFHGVPPFQLHPFQGSLFNVEASLSFPSGDVTLAAAMAMSLTIVIPRLWPLWWTLAMIVALERIAESAHFPSDTVAGAALGIAAALLAKKVVQLIAAEEENSPEPFSDVPKHSASGHIT